MRSERSSNRKTSVSTLIIPQSTSILVNAEESCRDYRQKRLDVFDGAFYNIEKAIEPYASESRHACPSGQERWR